jgi:predicted phosphatase
MNHKDEWQIGKRWHAGATEAKLLADTHLIFTTLIISHHIYRMFASHIIVTELNMAASVTLTRFRHVFCDDRSFWVHSATNKLRVSSRCYHAHRV